MRLGSEIWHAAAQAWSPMCVDAFPLQAETQPLDMESVTSAKVTPSPKQHIFEDETPDIPKPAKGLRRMKPCDLATKFEAAGKDSGLSAGEEECMIISAVSLS